MITQIVIMDEYIKIIQNKKHTQLARKKVKLHNKFSSMLNSSGFYTC